MTGKKEEDWLLVFEFEFCRTLILPWGWQTVAKAENRGAVLRSRLSFLWRGWCGQPPQRGMTTRTSDDEVRPAYMKAAPS